MNLLNGERGAYSLHLVGRIAEAQNFLAVAFVYCSLSKVE